MWVQGMHLLWLFSWRGSSSPSAVPFLVPALALYLLISSLLALYTSPISSRTSPALYPVFELALVWELAVLAQALEQASKR